MNVSVRDNCRFSFSSLFASSSDLNEGSCVLLVIIVISRYTDQVMTLPFASLSFELRHGNFAYYVTRVAMSSNDVTIPAFQTLLIELCLFVVWNISRFVVVSAEDENAFFEQTRGREHQIENGVYNLGRVLQFGHRIFCFY